VGQLTSVPEQAKGAQLVAGSPTMSVQVPFALAPPATVQAWQVPVQAELQHTPSTQMPDVH
jgi:hypothetical protein